MRPKSRNSADLLIRFAHAEAGATAIEYAVIAGFLSIMIAAAAAAIGQGLTGLYGQIVAAVS